MSVLKRSVLIILIGCLVAAPGLYAVDSPYTDPYVEDNPASKLGRGITNIILSPAEYIVQIAKLNETHDPVTAYFGGILQGTCRMVERIGGGIYETVTFPVPVPKKYRPLMDPPTTYEAMQDRHMFQAN